MILLDQTQNVERLVSAPSVCLMHLKVQIPSASGLTCRDTVGTVPLEVKATVVTALWNIPHVADWVTSRDAGNRVS